MKNESSYISIKDSSISITHITQTRNQSGKNKKRPMSAVMPRARPGSAITNSKSIQKLPSVITNSSTIDCSNTSNIAKNIYPIEKEKLFEETMQYKIVINKLKKELYDVKCENKKRTLLLNSKDNEIENIIKIHELEIESSLSPPSNYSEYTFNLIKKIKNEKKQIFSQLVEEKNIYKNLKKNSKLTEANEYSIENEILNEHLIKLNSLIENSLNVNRVQSSKINDKELLEQNMNQQLLIIDSLKNSIEENRKNEENFVKEIEAQKIKLELALKNIAKVNEENEKLKKQNDQLNEEKKKSSKVVKYTSLDTYEMKITNLQSQVAHYKSQAKKSDRIIQELMIVKENLLKINQNHTSRKDDSSSYKVIQTKKYFKNTDEEEISKLKKILEENKKKELELEQRVYQYQEKISNLNLNSNDNSNFGLNESNPFYSNDPKNDPIQSRLLTNEQITEFTYVLYKNFEAKKIFREEAKRDIIDQIFDSQTSTLTLEDLMSKFSNKVTQLLNCKNENDKILCSLFFGALCCNYEGNAIKIINSFLSLFSYLTKYDANTEEKYKKKIASKYKANFTSLQKSIDTYYSSTNSPCNKDYISLLTIKKILDNNPVINIKDKYIEFLFYYMKQYNDPATSLYDLKLSQLTELVQRESEDVASESIQEITPEVYFKEINTSIAELNTLCLKLKMKLSEIVKESLVTINKSPFTIINVDSFHEELTKRGVVLTELQLSCLYNKYCCNEDLKGMDIKEIEADIEKFDKENKNKDNVIEEEGEDLNGARYYDNDENLENSDEEDNEDEKIKSKIKHSS